MRRLALAVLCLAFLAISCQPTAVSLSDEDVTSIRSLGTAYVQGYLARDVDAVVAVFASDAVQMPPDIPGQVGSAAIRGSYEEAFAAPGTTDEFTMTPVEIDGLDGLAFDRGTWSWSGTMPGATEAISATGKYLTILRRQDDGTWLWASTIWNGDQPMPQTGAG